MVTPLRFIHKQHFFNFELLPSDLRTSILFYRCEFSPDHYNNSLYATLGIQPLDNHKKAVNKRKSEYLAGRYAAKNILKKHQLSNFNIQVGDNRSPVWPKSLIGSISHHQSTAVCAIAKLENIKALGIDIELILDINTINTVKDTIIDHDEKKLLGSCSLSFEQAFTLVFSAKESVFKALYPLVKQYFDFSAATVTSINIEQNSLTMILNKPLTPTFAAGFIIICYYKITNNEVITLAAIANK